MAGRAEIEIVASDSKLASGLQRARAKVSEWAVSIARGTSKVMGGAWAGVEKAVSKIKPGQMLRDSLSHAGGDAIGRLTNALTDGASSAVDFERKLTRFQIAGQRTPEDVDRLRTSIRALSRETGVASEKILDGAASYVAITGDADGAETAMKTFARVAVASGASMDDIAKTAASMRQNLKIDPKDFEKTFSILITQGKAGAIELSDLASQLSNVAPGFAEFAGARSVDGLAEMGAALQVVREKFGNADEAATGFRGMTTELQRHMKSLAKAGVNVVDPKTGKMRNFLEIVKDIAANSKLMKPGALIEALGEEKAVRAVRALIENLDEVERLKRDAAGSDAVSADYMTMQNSAAGKLDRTVNALKEKFAAMFTPDRIEKFGQALESIGGVLDAIGSKVSEIFEKWDRMRSDPHENAVDDAASMKGKSAKETEYAAREAERRAAALAGPAQDARDATSGWFGGLLAVTNPGIQTVKAIANEQDTQTELAGKLHRQAAFKAKLETEGKTNRAAAIANETGYQKAQLPGIDYNAMGMAIAKHLADELAKVPRPVVKMDGKSVSGVLDAASNPHGRNT